MPNTSSTISGLSENILNCLNWNLGPSNINLTDFTPIEYKNLPFNRFKPPFNQCTYMRVCLPKAGLCNDEGDLLKYAIVEAGTHRHIQYYAKPTIEFAQNTLIPELDAANIQIARENSDTTIIYP
jgi:hypothetical protein